MRGRVAEFVHEYERESIANTFNISLGGRRVGKVAEALAASTWPRRVIRAAQARRARREDGDVSGVRPWVFRVGKFVGSWMCVEDESEKSAGGRWSLKVALESDVFKGKTCFC